MASLDCFSFKTYWTTPARNLESSSWRGIFSARRFRRTADSFDMSQMRNFSNISTQFSKPKSHPSGCWHTQHLIGFSGWNPAYSRRVQFEFESMAAYTSHHPICSRIHRLWCWCSQGSLYLHIFALLGPILGVVSRVGVKFTWALHCHRKASLLKLPWDIHSWTQICASIPPTKLFFSQYLGKMVGLAMVGSTVPRFTTEDLESRATAQGSVRLSSLSNGMTRSVRKYEQAGGSENSLVEFHVSKEMDPRFH
jgi:hypothetical protein